jgi:hypothetical protein
MKPSRQYHMLAQKIQARPRHHADKVVLEFLGSVANDNGESCHGYKSIMKNTGIRREETVVAALKYWSALKGKTVVGWETGKGGGREGTNKYKLNLDAMKALVKEQGLFDPETGKALDHKIKKIGEKLPLVSGSRYNIRIGRQKGEPVGKATPSDSSYNHTSSSVFNRSLSSYIESPTRNDVLAENKNSSSGSPTVSPTAPTVSPAPRRIVDILQKPSPTPAPERSPEWLALNAKVDRAYAILQGYRASLKRLEEQTAEEVGMDSQEHYDALNEVKISIQEQDKEYKRLSAELRRIK